MAKPFKDWINVPDGSSYELSLTTVQGAGTGSADIVDDQGTQTTWNDGKIHPGPASLALKSPRFYNVVLTVALTKKGTNELKVEAKVVKPDGSPFGTNYVDTVKGKNGSIGVILFTMETA